MRPAVATQRLFPRLIGPSFTDLPPAVRAIHERDGRNTYTGTCRVERGQGRLSRICGAIASLPDAAERTPLTVLIDADVDGETWERQFGERAMRSRLRARGELLEERLGPATLCFELAAGRGAIDWKLVRVRVLGIPVPLALFAGTLARESLDGMRYCFDVEARLVVAGLLVRYSGTLDVHA